MRNDDFLLLYALPKFKQTAILDSCLDQPKGVDVIDLLGSNDKLRRHRIPRMAPAGGSAFTD